MTGKKNAQNEQLVELRQIMKLTLDQILHTQSGEKVAINAVCKLACPDQLLRLLIRIEQIWGSLSECVFCPWIEFSDASPLSNDSPLALRETIISPILCTLSFGTPPSYGSNGDRSVHMCSRDRPVS